MDRESVIEGRQCIHLSIVTSSEEQFGLSLCDWLFSPAVDRVQLFNITFIRSLSVSFIVLLSIPCFNEGDTHS